MSEVIGLIIFSALFLIICFYILGQMATGGNFHAEIKEYFRGHPRGSPCVESEKVLNNEEEWTEGHWSLPGGRNCMDPDVLAKRYYAEEMKKKKEAVH